MVRFSAVLSLSMVMAFGAACSPTEAPVDVEYDGVESRPVMIGGDADLDACSGLGQVKAGHTAVVRDAPLDEAQEVARLEPGTSVWICDETDVPEGWSGVVYAGPGQANVCAAVATPSESRIPAPSDCAAGWVKTSQDVELTAG
ncbi:hypothetical protein [Brevundimonas bacteroides]|uniref:hypothetical protein n=1 Tax=Brevundimonas bacteroides TaxID=74311 RepID=UPI001B80438F|nr:hypothetical protein [Brevundimonas bacteroides]